MGKITKTIQPKHKENLTPWLQEFVQSATTTPLPLLPKLLDSFPTRWPFPRGDLYHWISLLNRFDQILEKFCSIYKLNEGPQTADFDCNVLLLSADKSEGGKEQEDQNWDTEKLTELGFASDGDGTLIVAILKFTQMLLKHCSNRSIYASSPHLNDLLQSTDLSVVCAALQVGVELAERYQASVKRMGMSTRSFSAALLSNHYNIDLERVQLLAQPFVKTSIIKPTIADVTPAANTATSPTTSSPNATSATTSPNANVAASFPTLPATSSLAKVKEKGARSAVSMYANDLCAIVKQTGSSEDPSINANAQWNSWADVRVSYYPTVLSSPTMTTSTSSQSSDPASGERTNASATGSYVPSTPTPLRRSQTAHTPQSSPRSARPVAFADDSPSPSTRLQTTPGGANATSGEASCSGPKVKEIPHWVVLSQPIYKLLESIPSDTSNETKYELLNRLRVAKALTGSTESRQNALKARLLAIQNLAYIHPEITFLDKVLRQDSDEPRRFQLVYQLAELIRPSADGVSDVPLGLQAIALSLLGAILSFSSKTQDVISALNATVNHGVLLYVIRKAVAGMKQDDVGEQWTDEDEWRDNLFSLTLHITMSMTNNSPRSVPEILSAGLLDIMVDFLTIRSTIAERTFPTVIGFLDSLVYNVQTSLQSLVSANGLEIITDLITHEVRLARSLASEGRGTIQAYRSHVVDYDIPFYQQQNLKWLLKFVHHLMSNAFAFGGNTDRLLRNLVDKSALLASIREIMANVESFGSLVWTHSATILSDFLNNDPVSFSAICEAGLVQTFLTAVTGQEVSVSATPSHGEGDEAEGEEEDSDADDDTSTSAAAPITDSGEASTNNTALEPRGPGPLAQGIRASQEAITAVPNVLNAISLNAVGMRMVLSVKAFDSFFEIFESAEHVRLMFADPEIPANVGANFDELARHHPGLRPSISKAVLNMVIRLNQFGRNMAQTRGWGLRLVITDAAGTEMPANDDTLNGNSITSQPEDARTKDKTDMEMVDAEGQQTLSSGSNGEDTSARNSITPYIHAAATFLLHYTANVSLKQSLAQLGAIEHLLDLCTSPSLPHDFEDTMASRNLQTVISSLVENQPIIGLPSLVKRTRAAIEELQPMIETPDMQSYFGRFLSSDLACEDGTKEEVLTVMRSGSRMAKALLNTSALIRTLYQCFPYSSRSQTYTLHPVNVYDYHTSLVQALGPLLRSVIAQEMEVVRSVPQTWSSKKEIGIIQDPTNGQISVDRVDSASPGEDDVGFHDVLSVARLPKSSDKTNGASKAEQTSPRYRNYQILRVLLHSLMPATFPLLQTLGKALLPRRTERDAYSRSQHIKLAYTVAGTILNQLGQSDKRETAHVNYAILMLHTVHEMLVDRKPEARHSERTPTQVIAPVLIAFKQQGGFDRLNQMLRSFADEICTERAESEDSSVSRLAMIAMKKILELYAMVVNGKVITDSVSPYNILGRDTGRRLTELYVPTLVVELRMAILPVMRELWHSPLVEKVSASILSKMAEILKLIALADSEGGAYRRIDKSHPPELLKLTPAPFNWVNASPVISQLTASEGYGEDLAQEAAYRSNSSASPATEYCRAHKAGIAGTRSPIPDEELPGRASQTSTDTPSGPSSGSNAEERMALDTSGILSSALPIPASADHFVQSVISMGEEPSETHDSPSLEAREEDVAQPGALPDPSASSITTATTSTSTTTATESRTLVPKEDLDAERAHLREGLIDRCLEIITAHPESCHEVGELISVVVLRPTDKSVDDSTKEEIGDTLVNALISLTIEEDLKTNSRSISAIAHLLSLLLQDRDFFRLTLGSLRDNVVGLCQFLQVPLSTTEELAPWIPYIFLVFEILLSDDEQPGEIRWNPPVAEDDAVEPFQWPVKDRIVKDEDRQNLLRAILEILPRVGKEQSLAVSVLRILVILTRDRDTAKTVGEKKNLQRLFVMTKQLSGLGSVRLGENRISTYVLNILRHIVEDEETIKQMMRSEIRTALENQRTSRTMDVPSYLRQFSHVALRDPRLFVEVSNDMVRLTQWTANSDMSSQKLQIALKEPKQTAPKDDVAPALQGTEDLSIQDVIPTTESADSKMTDVQKTASQESKRPILENPDGVIDFLLSELSIYKEVDDRDPQAPPVSDNTDSKDTSTPGSSATGVSAELSDSKPSENKDKKLKAVFKATEHPIFIYRCFILRCLSELLQSYNRTKMEFINFKKKAHVQSNTSNTTVRPRTSILNYLLTELLPSNHGLDVSPETSIANKKKQATAMVTQSVLVALVSKTSETPVDRNQDKYDYGEEPDLLFVRRHVLDVMLKAYVAASSSNEPFEFRYSRMLALSELMQSMLGDKDREMHTTRAHADLSPERSQAQMRRLMYEKGYLSALTTSIADIDLAYPSVRKTIKHILRVLRIITSTAIQLSQSNILPDAATLESVEDDITSATSISDLEDDREETPDLYRNSALGILEPGRDMEEDYSEGSGEDDEMYDEEYGEEMDYEEEYSVDAEENMSDEEEEVGNMADMADMAAMAGVDPSLEITMEDEEDEDDEDEDDVMDGEQIGSDDEDDDLGIDVMDEEDRVEIEMDDNGPDDGSGWGSVVDDEEGDDEEENDEDDDIDYEAEAQDRDEAQVHGHGHVHPLGEIEFEGLGPQAGDDEEYDAVENLHSHNGPFVEEVDDEDEDEDDEEDPEALQDFDFDHFLREEHALEGIPAPNPALPNIPPMGWDTLVVDNAGAVFGGGPHRHRHDVRHLMRTSRLERPTADDDGVNPLLRRGSHPETGRDSSSRSHPNSGLLRLLSAGHVIGGAGHGESPLSILSDLITNLPSTLGRPGHSLHFQITHQGAPGEIHELSLPIPHHIHGGREATSDARRETFLEPSQAAAFHVESTVNRWAEETKMIFGTSHADKAIRLTSAILAQIVPPAIQREKERKAEEAEIKRRQEEERKAQEDEERKAREAKEAEEKAAQAKREAEERERLDAEAAAALAQSEERGTENDQNQGDEDDGDDDDAMEGVETSNDPVSDEAQASTANQPRVLTTIRGERVDVTELGIDPDYLEALPEEFREEVIAQTISQRRSAAREARESRDASEHGEQARTEVFQEFLEALPEELRAEIEQQERIEQRRREREEGRRQDVAAGQSAGAQDMDTASILMTFPPELRSQVLMDQGADIMDVLPPEMAAEARRHLRAHQPVPARERNPPSGSRVQADQPAAGAGDTSNKPQRKTVVQMLDKSGVATLLRLMFINVKGGSLENSLRHVFKDVCQNKQTRLEVISTLLQILQDGTTDIDAVERSFAHLSIKAKPPKEKDSKNPPTLKRASTGIAAQTPFQATSETSPVLIVQQCLDLLCFLAEQDVHVAPIFLTEQETVGAGLKRALSKKGKGKDLRAHKYAINCLLALLDRDLVMESSAIMDSLSLVLSKVTLPLLAYDRKLKELTEASKALDEKIEGLAENKTDAETSEFAKPADLSASDSKTDATTPGESAAPDTGDNKEKDKAEPVESSLAKLQEERQQLSKRIKAHPSPTIPMHNLNLIINIFVARECSSKTFKETLSAIKNLSVIPGAMDTFGKELAIQASNLSQNIKVHLDQLLPHIEKASTGTEIQGVALAKFSPGAADQNKLLRVLTALDHLFAQKKPESADNQELSNETKKQDLLATLYHNVTFKALWDQLSACLSAIRKRESLLNVATILLPLIEALMVVCKDTATAQAAVSQTTAKDMLLSSPQPESPMANLFFTFTEEHRRILNELVRNNPSLMKGTFSHLVKNPKVLEFDNKRNYFNRSVHNRSQMPSGRSYGTLQLSVRRDQVFHDSFKSLYFKSGDEMKFGKLNIRFHGEEGVDAGGVTREWFQVLARQMFNPDYALFVPVSSDRTTFHPNKLSGVNEEHLMFFKFIGRIIGKALYENRVLDCFFSRAVYKRILGKAVSVKDMESFDPDYYKSLVWMLENDITDIITESFAVEDDEFGVTKVADLCENGRNIPVTEDNKQDYVSLVVEHKLLKSVKEQMEHFLKGFHDIIPAELISIFNEQELELLISGLPEIDVDDWKSNTEYQNYTPSSQQIQWFWRAVRSFDKEERAKLLQFVTGTSKVPLNGFKELEGMNGVNRFNIHRDYGNKERLPSSHTCFNQLDLPEYESYEILRQQLLKAITAGSNYFGFA